MGEESETSRDLVSDSKDHYGDNANVAELSSLVVINYDRTEDQITRG